MAARPREENPIAGITLAILLECTAVVAFLVALEVLA